MKKGQIKTGWKFQQVFIYQTNRLISYLKSLKLERGLRGFIGRA